MTTIAKKLPMYLRPWQSTRGECSGNSKLTTARVYEIRRRFDADNSRPSVLAMAEEFEVSEKQIRDVGWRRAWKHVPEESHA